MTALFEFDPLPLTPVTADRIDVPPSSPSPADGGTPKVLGLDLSLTGTGVAGTGWADTIRFPARRRREDPVDYGHRRIAHIRGTLVDRYLAGVDLAVMEGLAFDAHDTDRQNAGLAWMIRHALWRRGVPYALVPPANLKQYATGKGGGPEADKKAVGRAVRSWFGWFDGDDNAADAAVLAAMGTHHLGHPLVDVTPIRLAAMRGARWPEVAHA